MKANKKLKILSIFCSAIGLCFSLFLLVIGLQSIGAEGWDKLGIIFIIPAIIGSIIIILDILVTIDKFKRGFFYSLISSIIKIVIMIILISDGMNEYFIYYFIIVTIPSIIHMYKLFFWQKND